MDLVYDCLKENELEKYHQAVIENAFTYLNLLKELNNDVLK
jgi:hypothetical protein